MMTTYIIKLETLALIQSPSSLLHMSYRNAEERINSHYQTYITHLFLQFFSGSIIADQNACEIVREYTLSIA
jgi:hypothetical protein